MDGNAFFSSRNFDGSGTVTSATGQGSYSRYHGDLTFNYGFSERLSIYGRGSWAFVNQNSDVRPGYGFGFADQTVGTSFRLYQSGNQTHLPFALDLQLQLDFPGYSTALSESTLTPYMGDGTFDFTSGIFVTVPWNSPPPGNNYQLSTVLGGGFTYRTAGFSSAIPWSIFNQYRPAKRGITLGVGALGIGSLRTDTLGIRSTLGSGGSFYTGATNPSLLQIQGKLGYQFDPHMHLYASVTQSIWGQAAPHALDFAMGFQIRWGGEGNIKPYLLTPEQYTHSNRGFVTYSLEARVIKSNDRLNLVKIDKGSQDGIEVGQVFDIFAVKKDGSIGDAIARGQVSSLKTNETALTISEYFKEMWIEEGFSAKRLIQ